jgi:transcription elongation factor Elf1
MRINCLSCGHRFEADDAYSDYEGPIKCLVCGGMMNIRIEEGMIKAMAPFAMTPPVSFPQQDETRQAA